MDTDAYYPPFWCVTTLSATAAFAPPTSGALTGATATAAFAPPTSGALTGATVSSEIDWRRDDARRLRMLQLAMEAKASNELGLGQDAGRWQRYKEQATARARRLLLRRLTPNERLMFEHKNEIVHYEPPSRGYRIRYGMQRNVIEEHNGRPFQQHCLHPTTWVPVPDVMLMQLLMLRACPEEFRQRANQCGTEWPWM